LRLRELDSSAASSTSSTSPSAGYILRQNGRLGTGDGLAPDGTLYDQYTFDGEAGQRVTITLTSNEFDTYLALVDEGGNLVAENDDSSAGNTNSEVSLTLPSTGTYLIIVNGYSTNDQGAYTLTVR
jgi:hypothetical protein